MNYKEYQKRVLKNESFKKAHEEHDLAFEIGQMVVEARIIRGLTQTELAQLVGTKQSGIARLENGYKLPSLRFLEKIAKALKTELLAPIFAFLKPKTPVVIGTIHVLTKAPIISEMEKEVNSLSITQPAQFN